MQVTVKANHGAHMLGHSSDLHFFNIQTTVDNPSVQTVTRFTAVLNPATIFKLRFMTLMSMEV